MIARAERYTACAQDAFAVTAWKLKAGSA